VRSEKDRLPVHPEALFYLTSPELLDRQHLFYPTLQEADLLLRCPNAVNGYELNRGKRLERAEIDVVAYGVKIGFLFYDLLLPVFRDEPIDQFLRFSDVFSAL
jgi:hypothetical protein